MDMYCQVVHYYSLQRPTEKMGTFRSGLSWRLLTGPPNKQSLHDSRLMDVAGAKAVGMAWMRLSHKDYTFSGISTHCRFRSHACLLCQTIQLNGSPLFDPSTSLKFPYHHMQLSFLQTQPQTKMSKVIRDLLFRPFSYLLWYCSGGRLCGHT